MTKLNVLMLTPSLVLAGAVCADLPRSLSFENQTATRIIPTQSEGSSNEKEVEFADLDNDGDLDLLVGVGSSDFGERKNKMYINDGGVFTEVSGTALIPEFAMADVTRNIFARDYDGDGWLDIYVINDSNTGGFGGNDHIYIAQHSGGVLTGYSEEGAARIASGGALGAACGGVSADFDMDGDIDVYSGNYPGPSQDRGLYNDGAGNLPDVTVAMVPPDGDYTVDVALGDMNGDGKMDLLISNWGTNYIYYNDNNGAGSGVGDFNYSNSTQNIGTAGNDENAMEAADFDNDGDMDFYWSGKVGTNGDRIWRNNGNDGSNKATFTEMNILPAAVTSIETRKASVADFNDDGRIDVFVAAQAGTVTRPTVLRNTSVNGVISFVDWTNANAFPNGTTHNGWHGGLADTNGDDDIDIVMGAFNGDHLFENVRANEVTEAGIGGALPAFFGGTPVAVLGSAAEGETDVYSATLTPGFVSIVVNGPDDYRVELRRNGSLVTSSDRGGLGVEEAFQWNTANGAYTIEIEVVASAGGGSNPADFDGSGEVDFNDLVSLLSAWGCVDCPYDIDGGGAGFGDLLVVLSSWGPVAGGSADYLLEVLGR